MKLDFGRTNIISFETEGDFYYALGFLAKPGRVELVWENNENQGAWGSEGRIQCYNDIDKFPKELSSKMSAGVGNILKRINCNEYVKYLNTYHKFVRNTRTHDVTLISSTVPTNYQANFTAGLQA